MGIFTILHTTQLAFASVCVAGCLEKCLLTAQAVQAFGDLCQCVHKLGKSILVAGTFECVAPRWQLLNLLRQLRLLLTLHTPASGALLSPAICVCS